MNHPEEFTKTSPNCITKWVLKERPHPPHAQLLLVLEQIKSSSPSMGCSRVLKLQNLLMQTSLTIFLQTKVRGAARIIISWAFKNSSNITPRLLPLAGNLNIDNTCFSCHPWSFFFFFFSFQKQNILQQRLDQKILHKSFHVSQYKWLSYYYLQTLISQKSLKYKVGLQVRLSKVYTFIAKSRKPSNECLPSEPMIMRVSP